MSGVNGAITYKLAKGTTSGAAATDAGCVTAAKEDETSETNALASDAKIVTAWNADSCKATKAQV